MRIARRAVERVIALPVAQGDGDIGLAQQHRAGGAQAFEHGGVRGGHIASMGRVAAGGRPAGDIEGFLDGEGDAVERSQRLSPRAPRIAPAAAARAASKSASTSALMLAWPRR